jgi:hypothetical protein
MPKQTLSRRNLLKSGIGLPLGLLLANAAAGRLMAAESNKVCADPNAMDGGQKSLRESLHYSEASPDSTKTCSGCGFFQPATEGCGTCVIFSGPANSNGHCDSWGAKS